jgi:hypothetical protein
VSDALLRAVTCAPAAPLASVQPEGARQEDTQPHSQQLLLVFCALLGGRHGACLHVQLGGTCERRAYVYDYEAPPLREAGKVPLTVRRSVTISRCAGTSPMQHQRAMTNDVPAHV